MGWLLVPTLELVAKRGPTNKTTGRGAKNEGFKKAEKQGGKMPQGK